MFVEAVRGGFERGTRHDNGKLGLSKKTGAVVFLVMVAVGLQPVEIVEDLARLSASYGVEVVQLMVEPMGSSGMPEPVFYVLVAEVVSIADLSMVPNLVADLVEVGG